MDSRLLSLSLLALLFGCAPTLSNTPPDDDDAADDDDVADDDDLADDDDSTWPDDDDSWGDDDDDIVSNCWPSEGWMELTSTAGNSFAGTWYDGEVAFTDGTVRVLSSDGLLVEFTTSFAQAFEGLADGPGRVYWVTPGNAPWGTDALLAVEVYEPMWTRVVLSNMALPTDELANDFQLWVQPDPFGCGEAIEEECGVSRGLPLSFEMFTFDGQYLQEYVLPGEWFESPPYVAFVHFGGRYYEEVWCPDTPEQEFAFAWATVFDEPVLGVSR